MPQPTLTIDLDALSANWRALDAASAPQVETAAVVKADGYGLGIHKVAPVLARAGVRSFFVAYAEEAAPLRDAIGPEPTIYVFGGYTPGDDALLAATGFIPLLNSPAQVAAYRARHPGGRYGLQLDSGMNRLGLEPEDLPGLDAAEPALVMSHLACSDTPEHPQNAVQLETFRRMTKGFRAPRCLAATGGVLLGPEFHFEMTRPGIGLYGGAPFTDARPVVTLDIPVIQTRTVHQGETVGYGATWTAAEPRRIATIAAGYADGVHRILTRGVTFHAGNTPCRNAGRVSMDLTGVDVTGVAPEPESLQLLGPHQGIDDVAAAAGTIGYEILTSLGHRYKRVYKGG